MVQKNGDVALIDWGQTKQISRRLKLNLARIITALANRPEKLTDKDYALFAKLVDEVGVKVRTIGSALLGRKVQGDDDCG